jgi:hypothetical protein
MQVWGAGNWIAQWETDIIHSAVWVQNVEHNKSSALTVVSLWYAVQI